MAMRPTTHRPMLSHTDLLVVATLLGIAVLLALVSASLGIHLV